MTILHDLHGLYVYAKLAFAALVFTVFFLAMGAAFFSIWFRVFAARHWPRAAGTITVSEVDVTTMDIGGPGSEPHVSRYPIIEYAYEVGGKQYRSRKIGILMDADSEAEELVAKFPKGSSVTVFYKPSDPTDCVIDHHIPRTQRKELIIMIVVAAVIAVFCVLKFAPATGLLPATLPH